MRTFTLLLCMSGCVGSDIYLTSVDEAAGLWSGEQVSVGQDELADTALSWCSYAIALELESGSLRLESVTEECSLYDVYREVLTCTPGVPVEGLLVGKGCERSVETSLGGLSEVEEAPSAERRFYPVILLGDQLQLGDQLLHRER